MCRKDLDDEGAVLDKTKRRDSQRFAKFFAEPRKEERKRRTESLFCSKTQQKSSITDYKALCLENSQAILKTSL